MKYIDFNDNKISKLSLGTVQFGLNYGIANRNGQPNQDDINNIIDYVIDNGINTFDTAQAYGVSEQVLGKALRDKNREELFIISKLKSNLFLNDLKLNIQSSLDNLEIDTLFGLLLHDSKLLYNWNSNYEKLIKDLIDSKKIKYFGVSIYTNKDFELALKNDSIKIIQIPFNIFDQRAITKKWLKKAKENNKLIFIRSIFLQGLFFLDIQQLKGNLILAKPYLEQLLNLQKKLNLTSAELAMSYVDTLATDSVLLFGCDTLRQAKENIYNYNNLPTLEQDILEEIQTLFKDIPEQITNPSLWGNI